MEPKNVNKHTARNRIPQKNEPLCTTSRGHPITIIIQYTTKEANREQQFRE